MNRPSLITLPRTLLPVSQVYWNWRRDLNYVFLTIAEILWLIPLLDLLTLGAPSTKYPEDLGTNILIIGANVTAALLLRRYLIYRRFSLHKQAPFQFIGTFLSLLLTLAYIPMATHTAPALDFSYQQAFALVGDEYLPYGFIYVPLVIFLWMRGFALGKLEITPVSASYQMRLGILIYFLVAILGTLQIQDHMLTLMPIFFASALMSSALARAQTLQIAEHLAGRKFGFSWLSFLASVVIAVTCVAYLLAIVFMGMDRATVFDILKFIGTGIIILLFVLFAPFLWLMQQIFGPIIAYMEDAFTGASVASADHRRVEISPSVDGGQIDLSGAISFLGNAFLTLAAITIILLFVISILNFIYLAITSMTDDIIGLDEEDSRGTRDTGNFRKKFTKRLADALDILRNFGIGQGLVGALTIRWAYVRLEREAKKRGFPRKKSETPYEYRLTCYQAFPDCDQSVSTIIDAYVGIRYGELPENHEDLNKVRTALNNVMASHLTSNQKT